MGDEKSSMKRLPSLSDLKLPAVSAAGLRPKEKFVPNVAARRGAGEAERALAATAEPAAATRGSGGSRGGRGARGGARPNTNFARREKRTIQTESVLEAGPSGSKLQADPSGVESVLPGNRSADAGSSVDFLVDDQTAYSQLFYDKFIADLCEPEADMQPVRLPLKLPPQLGDAAEMETDEAEPRAPRPHAGELGTLDSGQFSLLQLPELLPVLRRASAGASPMEDDSGDAVTKATEGLPLVSCRDPDEKDAHSGLQQVPSGRVGSLQRFKSGRLRLVIGGTSLDLLPASTPLFEQELVSVAVDHSGANGQVTVVGSVPNRFVCSPDFRAFLADPAQHMHVGAN